MERDTRYQGAILDGGRLLLLRQVEHATGRRYWVVPGGGIDPGESEEDCVRREMREETGLTVAIERLLLDEPCPPGVLYRRSKTYACTIVDGEPQPGHEPESEFADAYAFTDVGWFDLNDPAAWDETTRQPDSAHAHGFLLSVRAALGYAGAEERLP